MNLAIFDIDGTLVEGSTERRFWRYLVRQGRQGPRQLLQYCWFWVRFRSVYGAETAKKNKAYLAGLAVAEVDSLASRFVTTEILPQLYAPAVTRLKQHQRRGDTIVLISGTLEPIARALAAALGVLHVRATVCRQRDGTFLASPPKVHPFGAAKLALAAELAAQLHADLRRASAVRPDGPLLATARDNRWDIIASHDAPEALPH
jgi:phosphoserine phosphatase